MSDYNIDKINTSDLGMSAPTPKKPKYWVAVFAGLGVSIIVAIVLAVLGIWLEAEYAMILIIGAALVAGTIHNFVPENSMPGAIIGAILCPITYILYQIIMAMFGYSYESDNTVWWMLGGSVILGAYMGYNKESND